MFKDFLKEKISYLKLLTTLFFAVIVGTTAWLVNNWGSISMQFNAFTVVFLIVFIAITLIINRKIYRLLKELKIQEK